MRVKLDKTFPLAAPAAESWRLLQDVEEVAACMPGAKITQQINATSYKGEVTVKIGPATTAFKGELEVKSLDQDTRQLHMVGKGSDVRGASTASMDLTAKIHDVGNETSELVGACEVQVNGKLASFGSRMMTQVSEQILEQFAGNFASRVKPASEDITVNKDKSTGAVAAKSKPDTELNALILLWRSLVGMIKDLFRPKAKPSN